MPTNYTHYAFGSAVRDALPEELQVCVDENRDVFNFGVHGPDLLFYYHPLKANEVSRLGVAMHGQPGSVFFSKAKTILRNTQDPSERQARLAYILGFYTHFLLDATCHTFVEAHVLRAGVSHNKIEAEYDAYLLRRAGKQPTAVDRSLLLSPGKKTAESIAPFFGLTSEVMDEVLTSQKRALHVFYSPSGMKRGIIRGLIQLLHIKGNFGDLFLENEEDPRCQASNVRLDALQEEALTRAKTFLPGFLKFLHDDGQLNDFFDRHFEAVRTESGELDLHYA